MTLADLEQFEWFGAWEAIANDVERQFLETELTTTLHPEHVMYKRPITAIAYRRNANDVLFWVRGGDAHPQIAHVILSDDVEHTPGAPQCKLYMSIDAWKDAMVKEHL